MGRSVKSGSVSSISSNSDCYDNPVVDPEYIMQLVNDVRKFADVLEHLKEAFLSEENVSLHQLAHERLGELLRVLKLVISKHQSLNSVDILSATGTVISKVKAFQTFLWETWTIVHLWDSQSVEEAAPTKTYSWDQEDQFGKRMTCKGLSEQRRLIICYLKMTAG